MAQQMHRTKLMTITANALKQITGARPYCTPPAVTMALAAVINEWVATCQGTEVTVGDVAKFLQILRPYTPTLWQDRPPPEPTPVDLDKWRNPLTSSLPKNPWEEGSINLGEQGWLQAREPALAAFLKAEATGGDSYSGVARQRQEKQKRELLRNLRYTDVEHKINPFRRSNVTEQNHFRKSNPVEAAFYEREATVIPTLPWIGDTPNLTLMSRLAAERPAIYEMCKASVKTAQQWAREVHDTAKEMQVDVSVILGRDALAKP
jgi:hypothetical protein